MSTFNRRTYILRDGPSVLSRRDNTRRDKTPDSLHLLEKKRPTQAQNGGDLIPTESSYKDVPMKHTFYNKDEKNELPKEEKKPPSMAFTIDFGGDESSKRSPKIGDSLSKFVPKHRRNQSLSRAEEIRAKPREKSEKLVNVTKKPGPGGSKKLVPVTDTLKKKPPIDKDSEKPPVIHDSRGRKIHKVQAEKPLSPDRGVKTNVNSSAQYLINKMFSSAPDAHTVFNNSEPLHIPEKIKPQVLEDVETRRCAEEFGRQTLDSGYSGYPEEEDAVSEAGTYTIEKDEHHRVLAVLSDEEPLLSPLDEGSALDEGRGSDSPTSESTHKNSAWIREWAVQVARHQPTQGLKPDRVRTKGSSSSVPTPPFSSPVGTLNKPPHNGKVLLSSSGESQNRPRRILPTPPSKPQQMSDNSDSGDSPKLKEELSNGGRKSDSSLEAEKFLRDAESVVTAMQMRVSQMEEQNSPTTNRTPTGNRTPTARRATGRKNNSWSEQSDSSCSDIADTNPPLPMRFNRAFSLRRAQAQAQAGSAKPGVTGKTGDRKQIVAQKSSNYARMRRASEGRGSRHSVSSEREVNFNRNDGGRFSLRMQHSQVPPKSKSMPPKPVSGANTPKKKEPNKRPNAPPRSGSSLSAKEVEFQNWKRRKDYDPMKAAQQGRKSAGKKTPVQQVVNDRMSCSVTGSGTSTPTSAPILRSASFHGTDGMAATPTRQKKITYVTQTQKQQVQQQRLPQTRQPRHQEITNISRHSSRNSNISNLSSDYADEEQPRVRKTSFDESAGRGSMPTFSRGSPASSSLRSKGKLEALDNLVFTTIYSVSAKLRAASVSVLDKLKKQMSDDCDLFGKIEDTLAMVSQPESSSGESGSPTRPLATTLKNLRKVENTLVLLDEVLSIDLRDAPEAEASYLCKPWNGYDAEESC